MIDLQPSRFNLVLTPCQADFSELVTEFARQYFADQFTDYLLGANCLPHVTVCQFQGPTISKVLNGDISVELPDFSLGTDKDRIFQLKFDHFYLRSGRGQRASVAAATPHNAATCTVGLAVAINPALLELQQFYYEKLKQLGYTPLTLPEDYFPHLTLARLAGETIEMPNPVDFRHFFGSRDFSLGLALSNTAGVMLRRI